MENEVMNYRRAGNDPTRSRHLLSPAEVKAMISGGDSAPNYRDARTLSDLLVTPGFHKTGGTPEDVADEVMVWLTGERTIEESRALAQEEGRCATCGREYDCCCQGCPTCPQAKMEVGKISAAHARRQVALGDTDPREVV